jgi:hypothetical protein
MDAKELVFSELNPPLNATLITTVEQLPLVADFLGRVNSFGYDLETNITKTFVDRRIRTIQVGNRNEQYVIDLLAFAGSEEKLISGQGHYLPARWAKPIVGVLAGPLASKDYEKVGVNVQFEYETTLWCLGMRSFNYYDCLLAEKVIYAGRVGFYEKNFWGMDDMLLRYAKLRMSKDLQKSFDLSTPLTQDQVNYAAFDTRAPYAIKAGQQPLIEKGGLSMAVWIENLAVGAFGEMHQHGLLMDQDRWREKMAATQAKHKDNVKTLDTFFVPLVGDKDEVTFPNIVALENEWRELSESCNRRKGKTTEEIEQLKIRRDNARSAFYTARRDKKAFLDAYPSYEGKAAINYSATDQILDGLRKAGFGPKAVPNTSDQVLGKMVKDHPIIAAIQAYRSTAKEISTYGENWFAYINPVTGRIHPEMQQLGADTGRTSCRKPNSQNIPEDYRACFVAPPGWVWITVDMAGAEFRIMVEASGEEILIGAFEKGWDAHSVGAEIVFADEWKSGAQPDCAYYNVGPVEGKPGVFSDHQKCSCKIHKKLRNQVKAINFGIAYGMEAGKLADELGISKEDAQKILDKWRAAFPVLWAYLVKLGEEAKMKLVARTLSGRRRLFNAPDWDRAKVMARERAKKDGKDPDLVGSKQISRAYYGAYGSVEREGKNTPIQGTNADIAKIAMGAGYDHHGIAFMWHGLPIFGAILINFVHDEFNVLCPADRAEECRDYIGDCIRRAGAMLMKRVVMDYEGAISERWEK